MIHSRASLHCPHSLQCDCSCRREAPGSRPITLAAIGRSTPLRRGPTTKHRQIVGPKICVTRPSTSCSSKSCRSITREHSHNLSASPTRNKVVTILNGWQSGKSFRFTPRPACAVTGITGGLRRSVSPRRDVRSGDARMAGGLPYISLPASGSISRPDAKERQRALGPLRALPVN